MPPHLLVVQLRFARSEFVRGLDGVLDDEARRRFTPMNCISWTIGHLANQEDRYWNWLAQGARVTPALHELVGSGKPATTPPLDQMWEAWRLITSAADRYLDTLAGEALLTHFANPDNAGKPWAENVGTMLLRNIYHYWYHLGEGMAIRQLLGHANLPQYVGKMDTAGYRG